LFGILDDNIICGKKGCNETVIEQLKFYMIFPHETYSFRISIIIIIIDT